MALELGEACAAPMPLKAAVWNVKCAGGMKYEEEDAAGAVRNKTVGAEVIMVKGAGVTWE